MKRKRRKVLIDDWRRLAWRFWSIRVALFWGAVCGLWAAWPALQDFIRPVPFVALSVFMCAAIAGARVLRQPGIE